MNGMLSLILCCKLKTYFMTKHLSIFNNFLRQFGIYREFYRELRLAQPGFSRINNGQVKLPPCCSSKDYIIYFLDWHRTRRGPHFWALMHDAWKNYRIEHL